MGTLDIEKINHPEQPSIRRPGSNSASDTRGSDEENTRRLAMGGLRIRSQTVGKKGRERKGCHVKIQNT